MALEFELMPVIHRMARQALVKRGARARMVEAHGHEMHLVDLPGRGSGPPVVLLHGLGSSGLTFSRIILPLARYSRRVLAADLPGAGFSPQPAQPLSLEETTRTLVALYERELNGEPAVWFGNSLGGAMATMIASERPDLVKGLALSSPAGARVAPERFSALLQSFKISKWNEGRELLKRLYHRAPPLVPELMGFDMVKLFGRPIVHGYLNDSRTNTFIEEERLQKLRMPILLLWGKGEKLLPYEMIDYFRAHLPAHAEIEEVEGYGHVPHLEAHQHLAERIGNFVARLAPPQ
jgi:pimeloyl-ACP methyl ester carboxylesterase